MRPPSRLKIDERGMMVFAMLGIVILLVSIFAGAYFADIRSESQRSIIDIAELKELEREIDKVERELENVAEEAGYLAVEIVKENLNRDYTIQDLKRRVGKRTTEIFERDFEERYSDNIQSGNLILNIHLRPLKENQTDVEFIPLYLREERVDEEIWSEIPGFFEVKRTIHANIENQQTGSFSTRKIEIEREVKTDFFILAERMSDFDPTNIRKMMDCMLSGYLNIKLYDLAFEGDVGFKESFAETFGIEWLDQYRRGDFQGGEKRENVWKEGSNDFVERFTRDEGKISIESMISEDDFVHISKLAFLLEQIRAFRSYDETLLGTVSDYFGTEDNVVLNLIGEGRSNKVNLQGLVINLFQEKGVISDEIFLPDLFLSRLTEQGILSIIEDSEDRIDSSFWMMNDLVSGKIDHQEPWRYQDFTRKIDSVDELGSYESYLRVLFSLYSNNLDEVLKSFKVNSREVKEFVTEEIKRMEPLSWMEDVSIIGEKGTDQITKSILHRAKNLSMSFGFDEGSYDDTASPFFYMYFFNNWGFYGEEKNGKIVAEEIDHEGIHLGVQDKVKGEMRSRTQRLETESKSRYEEIDINIERYNEREWYEGDRDQIEVWESLNRTIEPLQGLKENRLFDEKNDPYVSESLKENHDELEEKIEDVEISMLDLEQEGKEYTEEILQMIEKYPGDKWRYETYRYLYDEGEGNGVEENYLNLTDAFLTATGEELTDSYNWSLESYELAGNIDPSKRTDQSIGYRAIGTFTQEMVREFESPAPLDYSNPRNLFELVNQNLLDLKEAREEEQKSRLMSILKGEGDPISENLEKSDLPDVSLDLTGKEVSSSDLEDVGMWWDETIFENSISSLERVRTELYKISNELMDQNVRNEPYSDYADASFYRTTINILDYLIQNINDYSDIISSKSRSSGYTYSGNNGYFKVPVVSAPIGTLTLHESRSLKHSGFSYTIDLEIDVDQKEDDLVQLQKISDTSTRAYRGDIYSGLEWVNPFSSRYRDYYNTALFFEYFISEIEVHLSPKGETRLVSERYSSSKFSRKFDSQTHSSSTELISPVPLLENRYSPRSVSVPVIASASIDRNVFNSSQNKAELTLEIERDEFMRDQNIVVEVLKRNDILTHESQARRRLTNLHHIFGEEDEATQKSLLFERIPSTEISDSSINIEFDLEDIEFPEDGKILDHMVIRIRPEIILAYTRRTRDLDQNVDFGNELYSVVPSFSTSEQMYRFGEEKDSYLDVFRIENRTESDFPYNGFDLVDNISNDSRVIRKDGYNYLVDFEKNLRYRDVLSGTYRGSYDDRYQNQLFIDPKDELDVGLSSSFSLTPENEYGYLIKNEFIPLYMRSSEEDKNFYPDRMMPLTDNLSREEWNSLHESLRNSGYTLIKDNAPYLYYDVGEFNCLKRVNNSFERTKRSIKEYYQNRKTAFTSPDISQSGREMLKEAQLVENFKENETSKRRSIFLAANFDLDHMELVGQLQEEYENFTLGPIAKSLDIIGENRTEILLDWLEQEREKSREIELRAFLSFDESFVENLNNETNAEDYKDALGSLDEKFEDMNFVEYRGFSIEGLSDIGSLHYLKENLEKEYVSVITGSGITPSALKELYVSYDIDIKRFADSIDRFSTSTQFTSIVREINLGEFERAIPLYVAGDLKESIVECMPFGEEHPYLLIDDRVAYASMKPVNSNVSVKEFIDESLKKAVSEIPSERGLVLIEVRSHDEFDIREITRYIGERVEHHDPLYQNISWVELRVNGETGSSYLHL